MSRALRAWDGAGLPVGTFELDDSGRISFSYDPSCNNPVSLSLPLGSGWRDDNPGLFLDGLLPDDDDERVRMQVALGAPSAHPFDLLEAVDAIGGLVFTASDEVPPSQDEPLVPATEWDIEARIGQAGAAGAWWERDDTRSRFSLAGTQGKFTLAMLGGRWFWPSASLPSTHIFKAEGVRAPGAVAVECATMDLAVACGLEVPAHGVVWAGSKQAYVVERFDRVAVDGGRHRRVHVEDLTQALGLSRNDKYLVDIPEVVALLREADPTDELAYGWLRQVAFNASAGNCDAHAKNYSLFPAAGRVALCPLYDAVATRFWPTFDASLAMPVNDKYFSGDLTPGDWARQAQACGLDGARVADCALAVASTAMEAALDTFSPLDPRMRDRLLTTIRECNRGMLQPEGIG